MGIYLIVMMFLAMLALGWWEICRSKRRFREAKLKLRMIYSEVEESPDLDDSVPNGNNVIGQEKNNEDKNRDQ